MDQRLKKLDRLFHPRSIAFVGATETIGKWGFIIYNNLIQGGYDGGIYPVNPGRDAVLGQKAYPSVRDIPDQVDLAVLTVPARQVPQAIVDCTARGIAACVVISAGFREVGGESAELEAECAQKARAGGMVLIGPNGQGVCCPEAKLYPWIPVNFYPPGGEVGVVSQSGNIQTLLIRDLVRYGFGVSKSISSGNEADLKTEDYLEYLADDPATKVILAYIEGIGDGRGFVERARMASQKKPVVVYKGGSTRSGASAAQSHTGAMAVPDRLFDSICRQAGLVRAHRLDDAGAIASAFLERPLPRGKRVAILTGGGGLGVVAADACTRLGLDVVELSEKTLSEIGGMMPEWWVPGNPVDMVAGLRFGTRKPILEILLKSGEVDSVILIRMGPPREKGKSRGPERKSGVDSVELMKAFKKRQLDMIIEIFDLMDRYQVPIYVVSNVTRDRDADTDEMPSRRMTAIFDNIDVACRAVKAMADYSYYQGRRSDRQG